MADNDVEIRVTADTSDATTALGRIDTGMQNVAKSTEGMGSKLANFGKVLAGAFALDKIKDMTLGVVEMTSKFNESKAQFNQIFQGQEGVTALEKINALSASVGANANRLKEPFMGFDMMFKGVGMSAEEAMNASTKAMKISADAGAFNNKSIEEASQALKSFTLGNLEAGDAIGIQANDASIASFASEKLGLSWKDATDAQKENARLDFAKNVLDLAGATDQASREQQTWSNVTANLTDSWKTFIATSEIANGVTDLATQAVIGLDNIIKNLDTTYATIKQNVKDFTAGLMEHIGIIEAVGFALGVLTVALLAYNAGAIMASISSGLQTVALMAMYATEAIATVATTALGTAFAFLTAPITLVILALGAVIAIGILVYKNWDWLKQKAGEFGAWVSAKFTELGAWIASVWDSVKAKASSIWDSIKSAIAGVASSIVNAWNSAIEAIKGFFSSAGNYVNGIWNSIKSVAVGVFDSIRSAISGAMDGAKNIVKNAIDAIKSFFNFSWSLPHIKLPHFSISGSFNPLKGEIPSLGVNWYAKGGIFNEPSMIGVGEAGQEAVLPMENASVMGQLGKTIASNMPDNAGSGSGNVVQNITLNVNGILDLKDSTAMGRLSKALVDNISQDLYKKQKRESSASGGRNPRY